MTFPLGTKTLILSLLVCGTLAGCGDNSALYLVEPPLPGEELPNRLGRVELREVVLPQYATAPEVTMQEADGALRAQPYALWADAPAAAVTRVLAGQISALSGATAVPEPWPLSQGPDRELNIRVSQILAGADGLFHLSGQYFVTPVMGPGRDVARSFNISVPLEGQGPAAVAAAQARALQQLARQIAALD
ncbi:hypothetical protein C8J27_102254 [Rhodobacter aestuarii]|uniref:ABC-type transport auxiliary lipoprotein component domain-containing protein n=1 Tax=Rhodobacter aestuarii TaxID=453582 RepID=A0A1N7NGY6_9RHOB|nr:ABC-type transport auxiliary lipoprotein family protein [Rhodobacter aestuarii]PTV96460.1 hypothetical protein C8J27_102254 [Rhodobacter aestuarii]SIS97521.1 hypothetical protein SAMN05421580_107254 [Rhodobacter aestuarii]